MWKIIPKLCAKLIGTYPNRPKLLGSSKYSYERAEYSCKQLFIINFDVKIFFTSKNNNKCYMMLYNKLMMEL